MGPKGKLPLSESGKLAAVDAELETAMARLTETNERIDDLLTNLEEEPEADGEVDVDSDKPMETEAVDGEEEK